MKLKKGCINKIISTMLVVAIIGGVVYNTGIINNKAKACENGILENNKSSELLKNVSYIDEAEVRGMEEAALIDSQEVVNCVVNDMEEEVSEVVSYKADGSRCISKVSTSQIDKLYYNEKDELVYTETINFNRTQEAINQNQMSTTRGTGIKVFEVFNFKHWYQMAINDKTLKIGCDASYQINYSKLSKTEKGICDAYTGAINSSNGCVAAAIAAIATIIIVSGGTASGIVVTVLDLASQGLTKEVIASFLLKKFAKYITKKVVATKIVEAIGGAISFSAFKAARSDVKKYYKLSRTYGKKI